MLPAPLYINTAVGTGSLVHALDAWRGCRRACHHGPQLGFVRHAARCKEAVNALLASNAGLGDKHELSCPIDVPVGMAAAGIRVACVSARVGKRQQHYG